MWTPSHQSLLTHRKTGRLLRALGLQGQEGRMQAIGHLHAFWWWCLDNAKDGDLSVLDPADIADGACWPGDPDTFVNSLVSAGFVDTTPLRIHDWMEYGGKLLQRLQTDAERKRAQRSHDDGIAGMSTGHPPDVAQGTFLPDAPRNRTPPQPDAAFETFFTAFWQTYPARVTETGRTVKLGKGTTHDRLLLLPAHQRDDMLTAVRHYRDSGIMPKDPERFVTTDKGRYWQQWIEPPIIQPGPLPGGNGKHRPGQPQPLDPAKYTGPTGKYSHLFNRQTADTEAPR